MQVKFYLGQKENCSLGDSTSDSSGRLLQTVSGGRSRYKILVKSEFSAIKQLFYKGFLIVTSADVSMKGFSAVLDMRRCKEQTPGVSERQRSLTHCNPWGWQRVRHDLVIKQSSCQCMTKTTEML